MPELVQDDAQQMRQQSFGDVLAEKARICMECRVEITGTMLRRGFLEAEDRCRAGHAGGSTSTRRARST